MLCEFVLEYLFAGIYTTPGLDLDSAHLRLRCVLEFKPFVFIHENVVGFPDDIIARTLSSYYDVETVVVNSLDCGLPISRKRKYTLCRLRSKLELHVY